MRAITPEDAQAHPISLTLNGQARSLQVLPWTTLLDLLREQLDLTGTKKGCDHGQCGACTVHVDGVAARACVIPAARVQGRAITTLEGLGDRVMPHPVQSAFIAAQAAQCGYCLNGMIMSAAALLAHEPRPSAQAVRDALAGNLCRCGTHLEILAAVERATRALADAARTPGEPP